MGCSEGFFGGLRGTRRVLSTFDTRGVLSGTRAAVGCTSGCTRCSLGNVSPHAFKLLRAHTRACTHARTHFEYPAYLSARVRVCAREQLLACACVCLCVFACVCVCLFVCVCVLLGLVHVCALASLCFCIFIGKHFSVCVFNARVERLCWPSPWHGGTGGIYSAACDARTAHACVLRWPSVGSLVCTQARRGRAVRPARRGLREVSTRPWSTPPAPSSSSAATASAPPTTGTCGSAPTEVRTGLARGARGVLGG